MRLHFNWLPGKDFQTTTFWEQVANGQPFVKQAKTLWIKNKTEISESEYVWSFIKFFWLGKQKILISSFCFYPMISWRLVTFYFLAKTLSFESGAMARFMQQDQ